MPVIVFAVVMLAALLHASWNAIVKSAPADHLFPPGRVDISSCGTLIAGFVLREQIGSRRVIAVCIIATGAAIRRLA